MIILNLLWHHPGPNVLITNVPKYISKQENKIFPYQFRTSLTS